MTPSPTLPPGASSPSFGSHLQPNSPATTLPYDDPYFHEFQPGSLHDDRALNNGDYEGGKGGRRKSRLNPPMHDDVGKRRSWLSFYWAISGIVGFRERYSFLFFFVFGGALVGFCLARTTTFSPAKLKATSTPGEWFWYRQDPYKGAIFFHIYTSIIAGIFAVFQFLPSIRRHYVILHRLNGYMILLLLIPGTATGGVVARRALGGDPSTQSVYYLITIMVIVSGLLGIYYVKHTQMHRKWMLRMVVYTATVITAKLISLAAQEIITNTGPYYAPWSCTELLFLQGTRKPDPHFNTTYPACVSTTDPDNTWALVLGTMKGGPANKGTATRLTLGMGLWVALFIHVFGAEVYLRLTESKNAYRRGFTLDRVPTAEEVSEKPRR